MKPITFDEKTEDSPARFWLENRLEKLFGDFLKEEGLSIVFREFDLVMTDNVSIMVFEVDQDLSKTEGTRLIDKFLCSHIKPWKRT